MAYLPLSDEVIPTRANPGPDDPATRYLQARPSGFWRGEILDEKAGISTVTKLRSVDYPSEEIIMKRLRRYEQWETSAMVGVPPEIEISTVSQRDTYVHRQLPLALNVFPEMLAFRVHKKLHTDFDVSMFFEFYNGGSLADLVQRHINSQTLVPEALIWHVIAQLGRAYAYLHTGKFIPSFEVGKPAPSLVTAEVPEWKPISHNDGYAYNIWLHQPSDQAKARDASLRQFDEDFPQVILGDFGLAFQAHLDRDDELRGHPCPGAHEYATWADKTALARCVMQLVLGSRLCFDTVAVDDRDEQQRLGRYSLALREVCARIKPLNDLFRRGYPLANRVLTDAVIRGALDGCLNEWMYGRLLATADEQVARFRVMRLV